MKKSGTRSNQFPWERLGYKRHLRWQLIGLFVLVQAVLLLTCGGVIAWLIYRMEVNSWQSRQGEVADNIAKTAATLLKDSESLVVFVGDMGSDRILKNPDIFTSMLRFNPGLDEVALLDSKGAILTSVAKDEAVLTSVPSAVRVGWYNAAVSGQRYVGDLQRSAQNAPYLVVAVPARGGNVVVARLQAAMLEKLINDVRFGNGGRAYILNRDGVLVAHTDSQVALKRQALAGRPEVEAVKAQPSQVLHKEYTNFQGVRVVGSAELIPEQDWMVFAELPVDNAYVVSKTAIFVVVAGLVVFGIAVSLGVNALLKKMVIRPVQFIQQGASEIGKGNFSYRIPVDRCDEIGQLAEAVNHMAGELQARETQLAQETEKLAAEVTERKRVERDLHLAKEGLEKRVQERTAELQLEINERKRAEQQLLYDAFHDALTGLP
ncbi:MAG: HAMP domain-containing protein, partial [Chloroflexi bacterium]|nr:HAMP domain-containing protein [Chloroflexota bacterium]